MNYTHPLGDALGQKNRKGTRTWWAELSGIGMAGHG